MRLGAVQLRPTGKLLGLQALPSPSSRSYNDSAMSDRAIEHELIRQASCLVDLQVVDTQVEHFGENTHVKITMREDPEILASCALGIIFAFGVLSFHDARPRGVSDMHFIENDSWTAADMIQHLRFPRGRIEFDADYVRGRMMKTVVEVHADGTITLETNNRGESATRWVSRLQGKRIISLAANAD